MGYLVPRTLVTVAAGVAALGVQVTLGRAALGVTRAAAPTG